MPTRRGARGDLNYQLHRLFGDVNGDKAVNGLDLTAFRSAFGTVLGDTNYNAALDFNGDGVVNGTDPHRVPQPVRLDSA